MVDLIDFYNTFKKWSNTREYSKKRYESLLNNHFGYVNGKLYLDDFLPGEYRQSIISSTFVFNDFTYNPGEYGEYSKYEYYYHILFNSIVDVQEVILTYTVDDIIFNEVQVHPDYSNNKITGYFESLKPVKSIKITINNCEYNSTFFTGLNTIIEYTGTSPIIINQRNVLLEAQGNNLKIRNVDAFSPNQQIRLFGNGGEYLSLLFYPT